MIADLHLGERPDDLQRFATLAGELRARGVGEATFLGDLFRTLVGFPRYWDGTVRAGLEMLGDVRAAGIRIVLVEGNRDFFLDEPCLDPYRDVSGTAHSFEAGGRRFLLEHGDLINRQDRLYRFWRTVSKSRVARWGARVIPAALARQAVTQTERRLAQTNFSYRKRLPEVDLEREARRHFVSGVDTVLWGHFHRGWRFELDGRLALCLPAWAQTGAVAWIAADGELRLQSGNE